MVDVKLPPIDEIYPTDITPIIEYLENEMGMSERQVKHWFRKNYADYKNHCAEYYEARNAGLPNPLHKPINLSKD